MKTQCPKCSQEYDIEPDNVGHHTTCPVCGESFIIAVMPEIEPPSAPETPTLPEVAYRPCPDNMRRCPECGKIVSLRAFSCPNCGCPFEASVSYQQPMTNIIIQQAPPATAPKYSPEMQKSRAVYILLALFLGVPGIHNLYAEYIADGIIALILFIVSLILPIMGYFMIPILGIFALANIICRSKDGHGVPFK